MNEALKTICDPFPRFIHRQRILRTIFILRRFPLFSPSRKLSIEITRNFAPRFENYVLRRKIYVRGDDIDLRRGRIVWENRFAQPRSPSRLTFREVSASSRFSILYSALRSSPTFGFRDTIRISRSNCELRTI